MYSTEPKNANVKLSAKQTVVPPHIAERCKTLQKRVDELERLHIDDKKSVSGISPSSMFLL